MRGIEPAGNADFEGLENVPEERIPGRRSLSTLMGEPS